MATSSYVANQDLLTPTHTLALLGGSLSGVGKGGLAGGGVGFIIGSLHCVEVGGDCG